MVFEWPSELGRERVKFGVGGRGRIIGGVSLTRHQLGARVDDDDMALFKVFYEGMEILEVETAAGVVAALWGAAIDCLATNEKRTDGVKKLTSSSSRSMAESALMMEPLSDSMEEEIFPASRRSAGL